jgi:virginiamycin A acetyltransferase
MSGVKIGDGSVIAANSHVVKDVEPYSMVGGNPAKLIRYRFTNEQISLLLKIQWWNWNIEKINKELSNLCCANIQAFIDKHT